MESMPQAVKKRDQTVLTAQQQAAVDSAIRFAHNSEGIGAEFLLSGLAGTGKTTTLVEIVARLRAEGYRPCVCTPTGKAAHVINSKQSVFLAKTLHSALSKRPNDGLALIHQRLDELEIKWNSETGLTPEEQEEEAALLKKLDKAKKNGGALSFEPIPVDEFFMSYDTLVFDESSMIGKRETYDKLIERIPCRKYFVGDEAQLPPVKDVPAVNLARANAKLTQILRQGSDSGILAFAHAVHGGKVMKAAEMEKYPDLTVVKDHHYKSVDNFLTEHQIVVWKNDERAQINTRARIARGFDFTTQKHTHLPLPGETLMVDKNSPEQRLLSGEILTVESVDEYNFWGNPYLATITASDSRGHIRSIMISMTDMAYKTILNPNHSEVEDQRARRDAERRGLRVMFSYAITCHKAQGSEWDKVVYVGSMMPFSTKEWKAHWYTGCTRARKELVVASYHFAHEFDD